MKRFVFLFLALFLILFEAIPEGLALGGHKTIAGVIESIYLLGITVAMFAWMAGLQFKWWKSTSDILKILVGYVLLRFALFDITYNISAGLSNPFFIGSTKVFDIIMSKLGTWGWFLRIIGLVWGTAWLMEWWNGIRIKR